MPSAHAACPAKSVVSLRGTLLFEGDRLDDELTRLANMIHGAFPGAGSVVFLGDVVVRLVELLDRKSVV